MSLVQTGRDVVAVAKRAQISMLAAGLAYFGFTSLLPLALLLVVLFSAVADDAMVVRLVEVTASVLGDDLGRRVAQAVLAEERRVSSSIIGVGIFAWSAQRLFRGTDRAFAAVYGSHEEKSFLRTARDGLVVSATNVVAILLLGGVAIVFGLTTGVAARLAPMGVFLLLIVVFLPMFYVFPTADVTLLEVLPGTVIAAGAWAVASVGVGIYAGTAGAASYGAAATALLVLTWLYIGGLALLAGATLNAVLGGRVDPEEEWRPDV